jgi:hypothetical protein
VAVVVSGVVSFSAVVLVVASSVLVVAVARIASTTTVVAVAAVAVVSAGRTMTSLSVPASLLSTFALSGT